MTDTKPETLLNKIWAGALKILGSVIAIWAAIEIIKSLWLAAAIIILLAGIGVGVWVWWQKRNQY